DADLLLRPSGRDTEAHNDFIQQGFGRGTLGWLELTGQVELQLRIGPALSGHLFVLLGIDPSAVFRTAGQLPAFQITGHVGVGPEAFIVTKGDPYLAPPGDLTWFIGDLRDGRLDFFFHRLHFDRGRDGLRSRYRLDRRFDRRSLLFFLFFFLPVLSDHWEIHIG